MSTALYLCYALPSDDLNPGAESRTKTQEFINDLYSQLSKEYSSVTRHEYEPGIRSEKSAEALRPSHVLFVISNAAFAHPDAQRDLEYALGENNTKLIPISWEKYDPEEIKLYTSGEWDTFSARLQILKAGVDKLNWVQFGKLNEKQVTNKPERRNETEEEKKAREEKEKTDIFARWFRLLIQAIGNQPNIYDFLISYNRHNTELIKAFKRGLEAPEDPGLNRYNVWLDDEDIQPAEAWNDAITRGIIASDVILLFVSNSWLGSYNCHTEYLRAVDEYGKVVIPITFDEPRIDSKDIWHSLEIEAATNEMMRRKTQGDGWFNEDREQGKGLIQAKLEDLSKNHQPIHLSGELARILLSSSDDDEEIAPTDDDKRENVSTHPEFIRVLDEIRKRYQDHHPLTRRHTELLIQETTKKDSVLSFGEWKTARRWLKENARTTSRPRATDVHKALIKRSRNHFLRIASAIAGTLIIFTVILLASIFITDAQGREALALQEAEAQKAINNETNRALQTLAQVNAQNTYPVGEQAHRPVHYQDSIWVSDSTGLLNRFPISGESPSDPMQLGRSLSMAQTAHGYLWFYSADDYRLYRFDPQNNSHESVELPSTLRSFVIEEDYLWGISTIGRRLYQINALAPTLSVINQIPISPDEVHLSGGGGFIWTFDRLNGAVRQINATTATSQQFTGFDNLVYNLQYQGGMLWLKTDQSFLRVDPETGQVLARTLTPVGDIQTQHDTLIFALTEDNHGIIALDTNTLQVKHTYVLPPNSGEVRRLHITPDRLWAFTANSLVLVFEINDSSLINQTRVSSAGTFGEPVSDGTHLWVTPTNQGESYVFNLQDGTLYRRLQLCAGASSPVFDGGRMWFTCTDEQRVIAIPAHGAFFGVRALTESRFQHQPLIVDGYLWIVQEQTGRLMIYDPIQGELVAETTLAASLIPLVDDGKYLWTAAANTGEVFRITPQLFDPDNLQAFISRVNVERSVSNMERIGEYIWVYHDDPRPGLQLTVISRDTNQVERQVRELGIGVWSALEFGEDVWVLTATPSEGYLVRMSPQGEELERIDIPNTNYSAWNIVSVDNVLWLNVVVPRLEDIIPVLFGLQRDRETLDQLLQQRLFSLRSYNTTTRSWGQEPIWLPAPVSLPHLTVGNDGQPWIWFNVLSSPPSMTGGVEVGTESGELAVNLTTGERVTFLDRCIYTDTGGTPRYGTGSNPYLYGNFLYAGCYSRSSEMVVYDVRTQERVWVYPNAGLRPRRLIADNGRVWITFEVSRSLAMFDASTGEKQMQWGTQSAPGIPLVHEGFVWIYHSAADMLQRWTIP